LSQNLAPTVSVVTVVHNGQQYLHLAVESILTQTFRDFELVIVDDGSTDSTPEILNRFSDGRIRRLRNSANLGVRRARNCALAAARGKLIAIQDADDISSRERLAQQVKVLRRRRDVAVIGSDYFEVNENSESSIRVRMPVGDAPIKWHGLFQSPIANATSMFRRETAAQVGDYSESDALHGEDYDLWVRLIWARQRFANLHKPLVRVGCNPTGLSRTDPELQSTNFHAIVQGNLERLVPILRDDEALADLIWKLQVCGGFDQPLEQVERALKVLDELTENFCEYFKLDSRQQRRVHQIARRRTARSLLHNAQQLSYAGRMAKANEFARLATSLDKRLALSSGYGKLRVKNLLGRRSTQRLQNAQKRIKSAIHPS